jgi:phage tail sheath protein FI
MATQVSYPGIYIQEFTPGAPIQGVGTSTPAFIGTAASGPANQPTFLTSWDEFQKVFGGFIAEPPNMDITQRSWLAPAVYGFFLNGGTGCYIVRAVKLGAGKSLFASWNLADASPQTELVATSIAEGNVGNSISVAVKSSSLLAHMLGAPTLTAKGPLSKNDITIPVDLSAAPSTFVLSQALPPGALIEIGGSEFVTVASTSVNTATKTGTIVLTTGLANAHSPAPTIASVEWELDVTGATAENWLYLSMNPQHRGYWKTAVKSQLITLSLPQTAPGATPNPTPVSAASATTGTDDDRAADLSDINTNPTAYLDLLKPLQDVEIVAIPGDTNVNAQQALIAHCENLFNRFAVLDAAPDSSVGFSNLQTQYGQVRTTNGFAAIYFPWIQVVNPLTAATEYWPPAGHVIGIYAQTDQRIGVYKAPANVPIAGALGVQSLLSDNDQGPLNLLGINILRVFPEQSQPLVFGARTTSTDASWQYINIRRLFIFLEQSIVRGIRWALFGVNNPNLWGSLKRTITEFLNRLKGDGGIIDFYVRIDAALNPPAVQALGQLYIEVGIQPAYPAEFIILRIGIWQGGSSVTEG